VDSDVERQSRGQGDEEDEDEIAKFREFLDRIEPEDFEHGSEQ
jgi:hypothetical protein